MNNIQKAFNFIGIVAAIGFLFGSAMLVIFLRENKPEVQKEIIKVDSSFNNTWVLIGTRDGCHLYYKKINGHPLYWSVCSASSNSSITHY